METPAAAVQRYRNSFSIENILSKPVTNSKCNDLKLKYNLSMAVHDHCERNLHLADNESAKNLDATVELRPSSPESSFTEDNGDDAKSDITSEDDHGKCLAYRLRIIHTFRKLAHSIKISVRPVVTGK